MQGVAAFTEAVVPSGDHAPEGANVGDSVEEERRRVRPDHRHLARHRPPATQPILDLAQDAGLQVPRRSLALPAADGRRSKAGGGEASTRECD